MERYFTFPGTGDGIRVFAKAVDMDCLGVFADPDKVTVMRPDLDGDWVKFDDALQRSRQEFDKGKAEGLKQAAKPHVIACDDCYDSGQAQGREEAYAAAAQVAHVAEERHAQELKAANWGKRDAEAKSKDAILTAYQDGLKVGRAQGQAKLDAYKASVEGVATEALVKSAHPVMVFDPQPTHLNQLLNELYHDRARLETSVKDLVTTLQVVSDWLYKECEPIAEMSDKQQHAYILGITDQALDTYGDKS